MTTAAICLLLAAIIAVFVGAFLHHLLHDRSQP
jgi:hypothetical protein